MSGAVRTADPAAAWHTDHVYFARLLDLLQGEVELSRRGRQPRYEVMLDVVEYLQVYGDRYHHAREDAAFALLARRRPALAGMLERLQHDHVLLARLGERLLQYLNEIVEGFAVAPEELHAVATSYVIFYREHLAIEEGEILRAAFGALSVEDWDAIERKLPSRFDPLFGAKPEQRYRELRNTLRI